MRVSIRHEGMYNPLPKSINTCNLSIKRVRLFMERQVKRGIRGNVGKPAIFFRIFRYFRVFRVLLGFPWLSSRRGHIPIQNEV